MVQTIANVYAVTISLVAIYVSTSTVPKRPGSAFEPQYPQDWWNPVFYLALVSFVAILTMTRVARNGVFWMFAGAFNLAVAFLCFVMLLVVAQKTR